MSTALFLDIETTGLEPASEEILEVAFVLVDTLAWTPIRRLSFVTLTPEATKRVANLDSINEYVQKMHTKSGLFDEIKSALVTQGSIKSYAEWESQILSLISGWGVKNEPVWGSSVHFDRKFLAHHMPKLNDYFHYRVVDSSSTMERLRKTNRALARAISVDPTKLSGVGTKHRALDDIMYSVDIERLLDKHLYSKVLR